MHFDPVTREEGVIREWSFVKQQGLFTAWPSARKREWKDTGNNDCNA
jgi:hypothetical protein